MIKKSFKTQFSGRRRSVTRKSGFNVNYNFRGTKLKFEKGFGIEIPKKQSLKIKFEINNNDKNNWICYGLYFNPTKPIKLEVNNKDISKKTLNYYGPDCWSKIGSIWQSNKNHTVEIIFKTEEKNIIYFFDYNCGLVNYKYLNINNELWIKRSNDPEIRNQIYNRICSNLHTFSPEINFISTKGKISFDKKINNKLSKPISLKNCNRCNRFLPVNLESNERKQLAYSNHCGEAKNKCTHSSFGIIEEETTGNIKQLRYGFQLECRVCKKFEVNTALNPLRTSSQLKEDGQRRRNFELLLTHLYNASPSLSYRHRTGKELTDEIFKKFGGRCFKCKTTLSLTSKKNKMRLDHTRPLAFLWPLDETATSLCGNCNSQKSAKSPKDFYTLNEIKELSKITGLSENELNDPKPNEKALRKLIESEKWFFKKFLTKKELFKQKDGKNSAELICVALDKVVQASNLKNSFSFHKKYKENFY